MERRIDRIKVTIEPYRDLAYIPDEMILKIEVIVSSQRFHFQEIMRNDEIESPFDRVFDIAKEKIKQSIINNLPVAPSTSGVSR